MQKDFSLILANTNRSKYYFKKIKEKKLKINTVIFYSKTYNSTLINDLKKYPFIKKLIFFKSNKLEITKIIKKIISIKSKYIIYSGYNAEILKSSLVLKKNLIHCHPGLIPNYRGSTTIYHSLINEKKIFTTIFIMSKNIDSGEILHVCKYKPPKNLRKIENTFDHEIRSKSILNFLITKKKFKRDKKIKNRLYYIAHPVIRDLVVNTKRYVT